ncbi:hypothetical protein DM01DRAFT_1374454 [Hesseltinella vesiculosa]|uniref:Uncharacterized protein n=1 Tax=Hesseltinella vesiculosa TaxID=101127 RepID=A0A1X2GIC5_9FUNG|nr:hypothetical protein DM01DRAFT_1374454 [Hesseltinella vesiculosa]
MTRQLFEKADAQYRLLMASVSQSTQFPEVTSVEFTRPLSSDGLSKEKKTTTTTSTPDSTIVTTITTTPFVTPVPASDEPGRHSGITSVDHDSSTSASHNRHSHVEKTTITYGPTTRTKLPQPTP